MKLGIKQGTKQGLSWGVAKIQQMLHKWEERERECGYLPCLINTTDVSLIQHMSHKYNSSTNATDVVQMQQLVV